MFTEIYLVGLQIDMYSWNIVLSRDEFYFTCKQTNLHDCIQLWLKNVDLHWSITIYTLNITYTCMNKKKNKVYMQINIINVLI